jgi:hypothetical protein
MNLNQLSVLEQIRARSIVARRCAAIRLNAQMQGAKSAIAQRAAPSEPKAKRTA